jgi:hypothetical protein
MEAATAMGIVRLGFSFNIEPLKLAERLKNVYATKCARKRNNILFYKIILSAVFIGDGSYPS